MDPSRSALSRRGCARALTAGASLAWTSLWCINSSGPTPSRCRSERTGIVAQEVVLNEHRNPPPEALEACKTFQAG